MTQQEIDTQKQAQREIIDSCNAQLKASDYKVIKCAEDKARGVTKANLPYDIDALHEERQDLRDRINAAQDEIARLEAEPIDEEVRDEN